MIPYYEMTGPACCFLGFPMNQNRRAIPAWSYILEIENPSRIVELGSYNGGFTLALALHAWNIKCEVHSFDLMRSPSEQWNGLAAFLGVMFYEADIWTQEERIQSLIVGSRKTILLCDGGNKVREFNTFAKYLKPGDIIAAHDYAARKDAWEWQEITLDQVSETVANQGLTPFRWDIFDEAGWLAFKKGG